MSVQYSTSQLHARLRAGDNDAAARRKLRRRMEIYVGAMVVRMNFWRERMSESDYTRLWQWETEFFTPWDREYKRRMYNSD
jgi:hypothetical protein